MSEQNKFQLTDLALVPDDVMAWTLAREVDSLSLVGVRAVVHHVDVLQLVHRARASVLTVVQVGAALYCRGGVCRAES